MSPEPRHLTVIVCGAGPARDVAVLIRSAQAEGWMVNVIATPAGLPFLDLEAIQGLTGFAVRHQQRAPGTPRDHGTPQASGMVIAPATFNTINKLAAGIADNYAMTIAAELLGRGVPTVIVPFVNSALASRAPYKRALSSLGSEGVRIIEGEADGWTPHEPGAGEERSRRFPWRQAVQLLMT